MKTNMKKLSFILVALFAGGFAMAQNISDTKQTGNSNELSVAQTGTNNLVGRIATESSPVTYSSQTGDENEATVTQDGTGNKAFFEQGTTLRYPGTLPASGNKNEITIDQDGLSNIAWGYSIGNENIVKVTQEAVGNSATESNQSGHWLWGNGNKATMSQTAGKLNYAYVAANSSGNSSTINQIGTNNNGTTSQGWIGYSNMDGNTATINQTGKDNMVSLPGTFVLAGYTPDLYGFGIQQYGMENEGTVNQFADANNAAIWQFGNDNEGTITQRSNLNTAYLIQLGDDNHASIEQKTGTMNKVTLKQTDGVLEGGEANIVQDGFGNVIKGLGLDEMATSFDGSYLKVDQIGNSNILNLQQTNGASAIVYQNGSANTSTVIQN